MSEYGQFFVSLPVVPAYERRGRYAQWHVSREDLWKILQNWDCVQWDRCSDSRPSTPGKYHATAITRKVLSAPISAYLADHAPVGRTLYHGVGRDIIGASALGAEKYDPYHTDPEIRKAPNGVFDEIHSHYTLNVVSKSQGYEILSHIYGLLRVGGRAVISVRRDLTSAGLTSAYAPVKDLST